MTGEHPDAEDLCQPEPTPEVQAHLEECAFCRTQRLLLRRAKEHVPATPPRLRIGFLLNQLSSHLSRRIPERFSRVPDVPWWRNTPHRPVVRVYDTLKDKPCDLAVVLGDPEDISAATARLEQLARVKHHALEPVEEVIVYGPTVLYVTEALRGEPLSGLTREENTAPSPSKTIVQLVTGIAALHERGLSHGNLTEEAVHIDNLGRTKISGYRIDGRDAGPDDAEQLAEDWRCLADLCKRYIIDEVDPRLQAFIESFEAGGASEALILRGLVELLPMGLEARRYRVLQHLGHGGMGDVRAVWDPHLQRPVALKRPKREGDEEAERHRAEGILAAQLQHPAIASVYEMGTWMDGRPYFTMPMFDPETLQGKIKEVHDGASRGAWSETSTGDGWNLWRLVEALYTVAGAVAYTHSQGVIHRDLKPSNVLVGSFGEVLVTDFGLAFNRRQKGPPKPRQGGTPGYMAPEQVYGQIDAQDERTDVFALGACLFHVLTGASPPVRDGTDATATFAASAIDERASTVSRGEAAALLAKSQFPIPPTLKALSLRCMSDDPADRLPDATSFGDQLRKWLDGSVQRDRARERLTQLDDKKARIESLRASARERRAEALEHLARVKPHEPISRKLSGWQLQDSAEEQDRSAERLLNEYIGDLQSILQAAPGLVEAESRLSAYYIDRLKAADVRQDEEEVAYYERLLRERPGDECARLARGEGRISLATNPRGAQVTAFRYRMFERRQVQRESVALGPTPLVEAPLRHGSWMLEIRHPGFDTVRYPVLIQRDEHWTGAPPGALRPHRIALPPAGVFGPDECYVPAGWFLSGDPEAADGLPFRKLWCWGFVMQRFAVTYANYLAFLNSMGAAAEPHVPRDPSAKGDPLYLPDYEFKNGEWRHVKEPDTEWRPDWPVMLVNQTSALAYAEWWSACQGGATWRLPHDLEWEKASRGVDGRLYPWGNFLDPTFANMVQSREKPLITSVRDFELDESPYGIRGLGGQRARPLCQRLRQARACRRCSRGSHHKLAAHQVRGHARRVGIQYAALLPGGESLRCGADKWGQLPRVPAGA